AAALIGAAVWRVHAGIAATRSPAVRRAATLAVAGLGLGAAASGIGVIVNATLAVAANPIAASGTRELLLGGISALVVGGPTWWLQWRPLRRPDPEEAVAVGRRVFLIAVFGASAIVALVALLIVGFRLFDFALDPTSGRVLVDRVRAPLGLLVATGLVFAYHFAVWRRDRAAVAAAAAAGEGTARRVRRIELVVEAPLAEEAARAVA
ncbi:DUF5671 domain-containing protein, partial [Agromyces seonyuensis]